MNASARVLVGILLASVAASACRGREAQQIRAAFESFIDFGMSNEERPLRPIKRQEALPHANERSRRIDEKAGGGPILRVEVDLPHALGSEEVRGALSYELDRLLDEGMQRVEVRGVPAGLAEYGGVMGIARGERSVDGGVGRTVTPHLSEEAPPLTRAQHTALVELELALARAGRGSKGAAEARRTVESIHGAPVVREAISTARRRFPRKR